MEKVSKFTFENGEMIISVDPNKDGKPLLKVVIDAAQIPAEVMSLLEKKPEAVAEVVAPQV
jgi:hypothetical protein